MQRVTTMKTLVVLLCVLLLYFRVDCGCPHNVLIRNQTELDRYIADEVSFSRENNDTRCIQWSLTGSTYQLDIVELMKINLQHSDSLIIQAHNGNMVDIDCVGGPAKLEELFEAVQPLSRASLLVLDSLNIVRCLMPILIEEVSKVIISNCVFQ